MIRNWSAPGQSGRTPAHRKPGRGDTTSEQASPQHSLAARTPPTQLPTRVRLPTNDLYPSPPRLRLYDPGPPAGGHCDADARPALSHLLAHVPAIHAAAQPEVGDHHIELLLLQQVQRGVSRGRD